MGIDINVTVKAEFFRRWMTVGQMKKCIDQLEDTDILFPNRVGNLSAMRDSEQKMIGFIDFNGERFEAV